MLGGLIPAPPIPMLKTEPPDAHPLQSTLESDLGPNSTLESGAGPINSPKPTFWKRILLGPDRFGILFQIDLDLGRQANPPDVEFFEINQ